METKLKQWGNSTGMVLPANVLSKSGLSVGDSIDIAVVGNEIRIKQVEPEKTLEELLLSSPEGSFDLTDEDRAWLSQKPVGKEI